MDVAGTGDGVDMQLNLRLSKGCVMESIDSEPQQMERPPKQCDIDGGWRELEVHKV